MKIDRYKVLVSGTGLVYHGESEAEAKRQFSIFELRSKTPSSNSGRATVTLLKNADILSQYRPPARGQATYFS